MSVAAAVGARKEKLEYLPWFKWNDVQSMPEPELGCEIPVPPPFIEDNIGIAPQAVLHQPFEFG